MSSDQWIPQNVGDPITYNSQTITTHATLTNQDMVVLCDTTNGNLTVTLPATNLVAGIEYIIKKIDGSSNSITILPNVSTETIDGATSQSISTAQESLTIMTNGLLWYII